DGNRESYLMDVNRAGDTDVNLTQHYAYDTSPALSPDGRWLAFTSNRDGNLDVYVQAVGSGEVRNISRHPAEDHHPVWSPDGVKLAFISNRDDNREIYVYDLASGALTNVSRHRSSDLSPVWRP